MSTDDDRKPDEAPKPAEASPYASKARRSELELRELVKGIVTDVITQEIEKTRVRVESRPDYEDEERQKDYKRELILAYFLMVIFAGIAVYGFINPIRSIAETRLPDNAIGVWYTTNPTYADRMFEIRNDALVFRTGPGTMNFTVHAIKKIRKQNLLNATLYVVDYVSNENLYEFRFIYTESPQPTIRFQNQRDFLWLKREPFTM